MSETREGGRVALLVMDFQPGILARLPDADALLERVAVAIATVRRQGGRIGFVRVAFAPDDLAALAGSPMGRLVTGGGEASPEAMHADAPSTAIHPTIAPEPGDIVVRKTRVGPFSTTDLDARLRSAGVDTLVLAGITTSGVVLSTVREAFDRDYRMYVLADATADPDPQTHKFLLGRVLPGQAEVITVDQLAGVLRAGAATH